MSRNYVVIKDAKGMRTMIRPHAIQLMAEVTGEKKERILQIVFVTGQAYLFNDANGTLMDAILSKLKGESWEDGGEEDVIEAET